MLEIPQEIQYSLDTWEPDQLQNLIFLGGIGEQYTWFIPCRPTLRHWRTNQYNFNITGLPNIVDLPPTGRFQVAIYRSYAPFNVIATAGNTFAVMVPGTYFDSGTQGGVYVATTADFDDTLALGGFYWIVMRFEDTTKLGSSSYQWAYLGFTLDDANLRGNIFQDTTSTGVLPSTYVTTNITAVANNYPWARADYT